MRKYYDADGREVPMSQAVSSKGGQGKIGRGCVTLFALALLVLGVAGIISAFHG